VKPATVTTTSPDGTVQTQECEPDDYVIVTGPLLYIAGIQLYANGTRVVTIKRSAE
jgi:hypothetical protein